MKLIELDEMEVFREVLHSKNLAFDDFVSFEIDTTDPKTDEIEALRGTLTVTRKSNSAVRQYVIGDRTIWMSQFQRDL